MQTLARAEPSFKMQGEMIAGSPRWHSSATRGREDPPSPPTPAIRRHPSTLGRDPARHKEFARGG